jgi:hypothetical protein
MGIPVLAGRGFGDEDAAGRHTMLINEALARIAFPGQTSIGRRLYSPDGTAFEVVGVVGDVRHAGLDRPPTPQIFRDARQSSGLPRPLSLGKYFAVRAEGSQRLIISNIRTIARQLDPRATVDNIATMDEIVSNSIARPRLYAMLLATFAGIAVTLAGISITA